MPIKFDRHNAIGVVREAAASSSDDESCSIWVHKIEQFSQLCEDCSVKTHVAFLGTAILAKTLNPAVDLYAIKSTHDAENPGAFSARWLCHQILVPLAAELQFSLGVTGREPLNNQPYFRMKKLDDQVPIHSKSRAAFDSMLALVGELQKCTDSSLPRAALCAFIAVRRRYIEEQEFYSSSQSLAPEALTCIIKIFLNEGSEGGKRAQAVVAGLMDTFAGEKRVDCARINDPSRRYPGDVCVYSSPDFKLIEKAIEVRHKPVAESDVRIFAGQCAAKGVLEAAIVMVAESQPQINLKLLTEEAEILGISLTLFMGWETFVEQVLFWAELPKPLAAAQACGRIQARLASIEVAQQSQARWQALVSRDGPDA